MIINHRHPDYIRARNRIGKSRYNGAYYYSKEICENIIPKIKTDRNWVTVELKNEPIDHAIVFVHNRIHLEWFEKYKGHDVILVVSVPGLCKKLKHIGPTIYLPLSVDVDYVKKYRREKDREVAFVGRKAKLREIPGSKLPNDIDYVCGMPREQLLREMARYKKIYAVDRVAIEGLILNCEILPYERNYPDPSIWKVMDNSEAAEILQRKLDEIDGGNNGKS